MESEKCSYTTFRLIFIVVVNSPSAIEKSLFRRTHFRMYCALLIAYF